MTRKDYIIIAEALRVEYHRLTLPVLDDAVMAATLSAYALETLNAVIDSLADSLQRDNSRFNREHFLAVVRGEKELLSRPSRNGRAS